VNSLTVFIRIGLGQVNGLVADWAKVARIVIGKAGGPPVRNQIASSLPLPKYFVKSEPSTTGSSRQPLSLQQAANGLHELCIDLVRDDHYVREQALRIEFALVEI
jgi:hypothetical protein